MVHLNHPNYFFQKRNSSAKKINSISDLKFARRSFLPAFFLVFVFSFACFFSVRSQTGYIYAHLKNINEEGSPDYSFTLTNSSGTTISNFSLNDQGTANNSPTGANFLYVYDIGVGHGSGGDGQLWAITGTSYQNPTSASANGTVYTRAAGSSQWTATTVTNAKAIDGAYQNQFVYVNTSGNVIFYSNGTSTTIYSSANATDVTANGGNIAIVTTAGQILLYNKTYSVGVAPATGGTWNTVVAANAGTRLDMNLAGNTIAFILSNSNTVETVPAVAASTATALPSPGIGKTNSGYVDIAYDDNGNIYATANASVNNDNIYSYNGSSWTLEAQSRFISRISAGVAKSVYGAPTNYSGYPASESIWTRQTDNSGNIYWVDDDRVKNNSSLNGNGIFLPVSPGTYTLTETLPSSSYDLGRYNIYDPGGLTTGNVSTQVVTYVVTAGEVVFAEYVNEKLNIFSVSNSNCGTAQYLQTFDASTSSPIDVSPTFGSGTYGIQVQGTAYHYWTDTTQPAYTPDGYYILEKTGTGWANSTLTDHTGNGGFFMVINASYAQDEFYRQRLNNLIIGASYTISFYAANMSYSSPIKPNISYGLQDLFGNVVAVQSTGTFPANTPWHQYSFTFTATTAQADIFFRNNTVGGNGNDLAIDDISLTPVAPSAPSLTPTNDCSLSGTITVTSPTGSGFEYSINGGTSYQSSAAFSSLAAGNYSVITRYVGTTGCTSSATASTISPLVCGNVYDDTTGLTDNTINGTGTNAGNSVYANLVNASTNLVVSSMLVASNGTFSLSSTSGTSYKIILTNSSQTVGSTLATSSLPSGWVSVGEYLGTGAGNDGTVDGKLSIGTISSNITNADFGIDQIPTTSNSTASSQPNPGTSTLVSVSATVFNGTDAEDGTYNNNLNGRTVTLNPASNGTLYYNGSPISSPATISNFNPSLVTISPSSTGVITATFTYTVKDNAGISSNASTASIPFSSSDQYYHGYVWDDANGNAAIDATESYTNAGGIYVNEVNYSTNQVVQSVLVNPSTGAYSLGYAYSSNYYNIILTNGPQLIGSTLTSSSLPSGWANTGTIYQSGSLTSFNNGMMTGFSSCFCTPYSDIDFGVDQLPTSDNKTFFNFDINYFTDAQANGNPTIVGYQGVPANSPGFSSYYSTLGDMTGSDSEDCSTASSCNNGKNFYIASISSTTLLYYNGSAVTAGSTISNFNPALLTVYGQKSQSNISFTYNLVDAAGKKSSASATWSLTTFFILALQMESFTATPVNNQSVLLNWISSSASTAEYYEVWRSTDGQSWTYLGKVAAGTSLSTNEQYSFTDYSPSSGMNYYRLNIVSNDGVSANSNIVSANINSFPGNIKIGPNPTSDQLQVSNMKDIQQINIYDINGRIVISENTNGSTSKTINVASLAQSMYVISFLNSNGQVEWKTKFLKTVK
jgi:hypothetical protein